MSIGVGVSHLAGRAITSNNAAVVYGWLEVFTLVDLAFTYARGVFRHGLNVDNLFEVESEAAVRNQSIIVPGMDTNV